MTAELNSAFDPRLPETRRLGRAKMIYVIGTDRFLQ